MLRRLRIIKQNVTYHIYSRCYANKLLMDPEFVKLITYKVINQAMKKYKFKLIYVEFTGDHLHIIIKTLNGEATISRIIQYIKARITETYNRTVKTTGSLWNERFKSEIIEDKTNPVQYFINLIWYLAYYVVRICKMRDPRNNPFCSISFLLNQCNPHKIPLTEHDYFTNLGDSPEERVKAFEKNEPRWIGDLLFA